MDWTPRFRVYDETGLNLQYTFLNVQDANYPNSTRKSVVHENFRGKGAIVVDGGEDTWELKITGIITSDDYEDLISSIETLESSVDLNTRYILKINKTETTYYEYKVKRISSIQWGDTNFRNDFIEYTVTFLVNSWA